MASDFTTKHYIVETSDIKATKAGHIFSLRDAVSNMDNGILVKVGALVTGTTEVFTAVTPVATDGGLVLIADVALMYDQYTTLQGAEYNYYNEAGKDTRAYELVKNDRYGVSVGAVTALVPATGLVTGAFITNDGRKYKEIATVAGTEGYVAQVMFTKKFGANDTRVYVRVIKN
jgi:hypothetical protein